MAGNKQLASLLPYGMTLKFHSFFHSVHTQYRHTMYNCYQVLFQLTKTKAEMQT